MTQVIDFIGGEYRNRTGLHGFATALEFFKYLNSNAFIEPKAQCGQFCIQEFLTSPYSANLIAASV